MRKDETTQYNIIQDQTSQHNIPQYEKYNIRHFIIPDKTIQSNKKQCKTHQDNTIQAKTR